jgi:hypothetical protein
MDLPSKSIIDVLVYFLPGFVTAALVYNLTPAVRSIPFERVIQALIYTILVQALVIVLRSLLFAVARANRPIGVWTTEVALIWSLAIAIMLGHVGRLGGEHGPRSLSAQEGRHHLPNFVREGMVWRLIEERRLRGSTFEGR